MDRDRIHDSVNRLMTVNEKPRTYDPQRGDYLEWCEEIRFKVTRVYERDGKVKIEFDGEVPLGIETWASGSGLVDIEDVRRLLFDGWEVIVGSDTIDLERR